YDLAIATYSRIPADSPLYRSAMIAKAAAMRHAGDPEAAIAALEALAQQFPDAPRVFQTLGDNYRFAKRCKDALAPYDRAVSLIDTPSAAAWRLFFARGVCNERVGNWQQAEADFLKALELKPDQPSVLNYLGYSWVEQQRNLDQALDMINRAVEARPEDGYIVDSLGWVYYRLGRYDEALSVMERAVELVPVDPVLNDHLGDVYWAVGRRLEAEFQWRRALSFITEDTDLDEVKPDRIRRKLEVGLDRVLEEEGAPPLHATDEGG
ncbi:MAG TPA: tetratricopeptide repeat protein, partial [Aliiroseovarius sp.]|nr:tetratricopeptide repeat protein [Aliiroseovarius sp.]